MKKMMVLVLALMMCALLMFSAVVKAEDSESGVPVTVNGVTQKLWWDKINILNGKMKVTVQGFNQVEGKNFGMLAVIAEGKEIKANSAKDDGKGSCVYGFDCSALPDAILFYPADGSEQAVLLWKDSSYGIPTDYTGEWKGTVTPGDGSPSFEMTMELRYDGKGTYSYRREDGGAMLPFTVQLQGAEFRAEIAQGTMPVKQVYGKWKMKRAGLTLEATAVYTEGENRDFSVLLKKVRMTDDGE